MHVTVVLDAFKKRGNFKDCEKAQKAYVEAKKLVELAEAGLSLLDSTAARPSKSRKKKALVKAKKPPKRPLQRPMKLSQKPTKLKKQPR
jgi:hypothetical protein